MTDHTSKAQRGHIFAALGIGIPLAAAMAALVFAVDTNESGRAAKGDLLVALVTGVDSADAHIVSMPLLWLARVLVVVALAGVVLYIRWVIQRGRAMKLTKANK